MRVDKIIIAVLYNHFVRMKDNGRRIVPWFQTCVALTFELTILITLLVFITLALIHKVDSFLEIKEQYFILCFIVILIFFFQTVKKIYFTSEKYVNCIGEFESKYSKETRKTISIIVLVASCLFPFLFVYALYLIRG